jgi:hypothetical protein
VVHQQALKIKADSRLLKQVGAVIAVGPIVL